MPTPEGRVKNAIKRVLARHGAYYFMPVQTGYGSPTLDFLVCHRGKFLSIEAKAPGGCLTKRQEVTMEKITAAGGVALVVHDKQTLTQLDSWLLLC